MYCCYFDIWQKRRYISLFIKFIYMPIRIFTIPFSEETQTFHDDLLAKFCTNKRIHKIETKFFTRNGLPFWTVAVQYGHILSEEKARQRGGHRDEVFDLNNQQKALLVKLKEWRREEADKEGFPVYIIATNAHLVSVIKNKCTSLECLKLVKGFGKKKIEKYGKSLTSIIQTFYEGS